MIREIEFAFWDRFVKKLERFLLCGAGPVYGHLQGLDGGEVGCGKSGQNHERIKKIKSFASAELFYGSI